MKTSLTPSNTTRSFNKHWSHLKEAFTSSNGDIYTNLTSVLILLFRLSVAKLSLNVKFDSQVKKLKAIKKHLVTILALEISEGKKLRQMISMVSVQEIPELGHLVSFIKKSFKCKKLDSNFHEEMMGYIQSFSRDISKDVIQNVWIVKPGNLSRGRNIAICRTLDEIKQAMTRSDIDDNSAKWIVQKYIENPLLITGRKFDIRLYVLITRSNPLMLWYYREYYLRLGARKYSTKDSDAPHVHLTNYSITKYLAVSDDEIHKERMLSRDEFADYLSNGFGFTAVEVLESKIRKMLVAVFSSSYLYLEDRLNTFEILGVDILVDKSLTPWLLEINASPSMETATFVTQNIIPKVTADLIKVIIDEKFGGSNPSASRIGGFEKLLIAPKHYPFTSEDNPLGLSVKGSKIKDLHLI